MHMNTCTYIWVVFSSTQTVFVGALNPFIFKAIIDMYDPISSFFIKKNPPAMQETWVQSLGWDDPLKEGMTNHATIPAWRIPMDRGSWQATARGNEESDTTEQRSRTQCT